MRRGYRDNTCILRYLGDTHIAQTIIRGSRTTTEPTSDAARGVEQREVDRGSRRNCNTVKVECGCITNTFAHQEVFDPSNPSSRNSKREQHGIESASTCSGFTEHKLEAGARGTNAPRTVIGCVKLPEQIARQVSRGVEHQATFKGKVTGTEVFRWCDCEIGRTYRHVQAVIEDDDRCSHWYRGVGLFFASRTAQRHLTDNCSLFCGGVLRQRYRRECSRYVGCALIHCLVCNTNVPDRVRRG
ncbi:hypothetical protein D3C71_1301290 [compost metagenome]